ISTGLRSSLVFLSHGGDLTATNVTGLFPAKIISNRHGDDFVSVDKLPLFL
ncbi:hypothetical protein U1Q18_022888, partial [Sarracenia purpurea var. burkii]